MNKQNGKKIAIFAIQRYANGFSPFDRPGFIFEFSGKNSTLPTEKVFPAHHSLEIKAEIIIRMRDAFRSLQADGKLHHGSGIYNYGDWSLSR